MHIIQCGEVSNIINIIIYISNINKNEIILIIIPLRNSFLIVILVIIYCHCSEDPNV